MSSLKKVAIVFFPFESPGDLGCAQGVERLFRRVSSYLSINDVRIEVYQFFKYAALISSEIIAVSDSKSLSRSKRPVAVRAGTLLAQGEKLLFVGGSHDSLTPILDVYKSLDGPTLIIMLDSHVDIKWDVLAGKAWSARHPIGPATFLSPFVEDDSNLRIAHVGSKHLFRDRKGQIANLSFFTYQDIAMLGEEGVFDALEEMAEKMGCRRVHVDIDLDILEGCKMAAVMDPASFGVRMDFIVRLLARLAAKPSFSGLSIEGYNPVANGADVYMEVCLRLIENCIYLFEEDSLRSLRPSI